jgi:transcriptional regulator with XRE-family HTH domain
MGLREMAERTGIPVSSYASMETGAYRIHLESLFRVLAALEIDITAVWPTESAGAQAADSEVPYLRRIQEFRLSEVINLSRAEGGALFCVSRGRCQVLMYQNLNDFLLDRLSLRLEDGEQMNPGLWWQRTYRDSSFHLFLKAEGCPDFVGKLVTHYLINWCALFAESLADKGSD